MILSHSDPQSCPAQCVLLSIPGFVSVDSLSCFFLIVIMFGLPKVPTPDAVFVVYMFCKSSRVLIEN